jgi:hypothetical protein
LQRDLSLRIGNGPIQHTTSRCAPLSDSLLCARRPERRAVGGSDYRQQYAFSSWSVALRPGRKSLFFGLARGKIMPLNGNFMSSVAMMMMMMKQNRRWSGGFRQTYSMKVLAKQTT